jgi:DNA primase large subunit
MQALIGALTAGTNITHTGRFSLTAFLHNIGMDSAQIVELFCRAPDFDVGKTLYQVEHISGRGGTEYTAPACAAMRTTGLCTRRDRTCEQVSHPLSYYKLKKRAAARKEKAGPGDNPTGNT